MWKRFWIIIAVILLFANISFGLELDADDNNGIDISNGGTNATTASAARTALGLAIGTNVQAYDADLTTYAGITPSANVQSLLGAATYSAFVTLIDEEVQDLIGAMLTGNTETDISVSYQDDDGTIDFEVSGSAYKSGTECDFYGSIVNPQAVYDATTSHAVTIAVNVPAAFTITAIYVSCDADPTTEPTITFQKKSTGVGYGSPTTIEAVTTTAGVASITSGIDVAAVAAGDKLFLTISDPDDALEEIAWQIKGDWD
jgi:hypothetical protein